MMMGTKVVAAFFLSNRPGKGRVKIAPGVYVRMVELPDARNLEDGLAYGVWTRHGETFMNTHWVRGSS